MSETTAGTTESGDSVVVRISNEGGCYPLPRWTLLEMQGVLEVSSPDVSVVELGTMKVDSEKNAVMSLGHARIEGKSQKVSRPILVLQRQKSGRTVAVGVVTEKFMFRQRPKYVKE